MRRELGYGDYLVDIGRVWEGRGYEGKEERGGGKEGGREDRPA